MTVVAIGLVKDEADIIEGWAGHLLDEVDLLLVGDNMSTDGTRAILNRLVDEADHRLHVIDDPEPAYLQGQKMSALAQRAAMDHGADWVLAVDADEVWYSRRGRIREVLAALPSWHTVVRAPIYDHRATALDPAGTDPFRTMVYRENVPLDRRMWKVAFRPQDGAKIHQGNHGVDLPDPGQVVDGGEQGVLELRHFPIRTPEQMVRKTRNGAAAYAAAGDRLPASMGAHWRDWGKLLEALGEEALHDVYRTYYWFLSPIDAGLIHDPPPYRRWELPPDAPMPT